MIVECRLAQAVGWRVVSHGRGDPLLNWFTLKPSCPPRLDHVTPRDLSFPEVCRFQGQGWHLVSCLMGADFTDGLLAGR